MFFQLSQELQEKHNSLNSIHWELYKDVYGFRPRHVDTTQWTVEQLEAEVAYLEAEAIRQNEVRRIAEANELVKFELRVEETIKLGAGTRETALRWIHDAEDVQGDTRFLEYKLGLAYHSIKG